jgi:hypothetical protein
MRGPLSAAHDRFCRSRVRDSPKREQGAETVGKRTIYCVQPFVGTGRRQVQAPVREFGSAKEAIATGEQLSRRYDAVLVYEVAADPALGLIGERVLRRFGSGAPR